MGFKFILGTVPIVSSSIISRYAASIKLITSISWFLECILFVYLSSNYYIPQERTATQCALV